MKIWKLFLLLLLSVLMWHYLRYFENSDNFYEDISHLSGTATFGIACYLSLLLARPFLDKYITVRFSTWLFFFVPIIGGFLGLSLGNVLTSIDYSLIDNFPSREIRAKVSFKREVRHKAGHTGYYIYYSLGRKYRNTVDKDEFRPGETVIIEYLEAIPAIRKVKKIDAAGVSAE